MKDEDGPITRSEDDNGIGGWIDTGMYYGVTLHFNLGLNVRYSQAEVTLFDKDREAGGVHVGATAGYHW